MLGPKPMRGVPVMATNDDVYQLLNDIQDQLDRREKDTRYGRRDIDQTLRTSENTVSRIENAQRQ